ncbi:MAG: hypothetical protein RMM51_04910 [Verrucomicrobiae bacterium]|nr:hypothetical protein [Verrucomicrobiae bacterium]
MSKMVWLMVWCWLPLVPQLAAEQRIPFDQLSGSERALVKSVTDHATLRRVYPPRRFTGRLEHFDFLMRNMVATSLLAEQLGLIRYHATWDDQGRVWADNRLGARGFMQKLHAEQGRYLYYVAGTQRGLFEAHGRGVTLVEAHEPSPQLVEYRATIWVKVDNAVLDVLTRVFQLFLQGAVDRNFAHVMRHPVTVAQLATTETDRVRSAIERLSPEHAEEVRQFSEML